MSCPGTCARGRRRRRCLKLTGRGRPAIFARRRPGAWIQGDSKGNRDCKPDEDRCRTHILNPVDPRQQEHKSGDEKHESHTGRRDRMNGSALKSEMRKVHRSSLSGEVVDQDTNIRRGGYSQPQFDEEKVVGDTWRKLFLHIVHSIQRARNRKNAGEEQGSRTEVDPSKPRIPRMVRRGSSIAATRADANQMQCNSARTAWPTESIMRGVRWLDSYRLQRNPQETAA